jgi:hypothetical protein
MNRGKHRSRKHVEGQPGHAAKAMPVTVAAAAQPGALATGGSGATAGIAISHQPQQPVKSYASNTIDPCSLQYNRWDHAAFRELQTYCSFYLASVQGFLVVFLHS